MADLDPDCLGKLLVRDLKEHLSNRGLSTVGLKAELVKRLREAILQEQNENNGENDPEKTDEEPMDTDKDEYSPEQLQNKEQEPDQLKSEEDSRSSEESLKAEEEARIQAEEQARIQAEEEARLQAEEQARIQAEEEARLQAEEQARIQAEEQARLQAEEEARIQAEEQARLQAEEEARIQAEEQARLQAEKEAQFHAEEQARLRAEEEARLRAEEEARLRAEEEARLRAEKEARIQAEEQARIQAEEQARIQAEERARLRAQELARLRAEEEARLRAEEEARLHAKEEARLRAEEEARQEAEKARILEERNSTSISEEIENTDYSSETYVDNSMIASKNDKKEKDVNTSEVIERNAHEEEMRMEQERWLVEEQMRKAQEEHKRRLKAEEEQNKMEELERSLHEEQTKPAEEIEMDEQNILIDEDIRLPQAIEKVLALKTERAQELGIDPDTGMRPETTAKGKASAVKSTSVALVTVDEDDVEDEESLVKSKESKKRRRKRKKKKTKLNDIQNKKDIQESEKQSKEMNVDVDIEYVQEVIDITDPLYGQFMKIFERFKLTDVDKEKEEAAANAIKDIAKETLNPMAFRKKPMDLDDDDDDDDDKDEKVEEEKPKLSKRKLKKLSRMSVAELKQKVNRPELVEMHDVTAKDPLLLLHLKASRNTVPVPRHWCFKRKYLQGKRGIEKPAFELPDFIKRTGIMEMRQALQEKEDQKTMKAKMRERVRPKLGKIDIDYQKLHDAFFKWQTKPKMTIHGDLYYEGKEFETRLKEKKPGDLSEDLRTALGMPTGPNAQKCPPPWLIAMQRYGPPPSYPNLKIPGLNAPIPEDCSFGYHAGGWGKPPVDEAGRPLYGDVFGTQIADNLPHIQEEEIDHTLWGELESESSEEEEDEEEEEEEDEEEKVEDETGLVTPAEGLITPSGFSSIPAGMETPDMIELRKRKIESEIEGGETPALYTILPEKKTDRVGAAMMASTHVYDMTNAIPASKLKMQAPPSAPSQGIEVALDPSELEMDSAAMAARYEQTMREQQSQLEKEDLSDMVAEHAARQKNKRKKQQLTSTKPPKKYKEFKF